MQVDRSDTAGQVQIVPEGYHTITPFIIVKGAANFIEFMKAAFDAVEINRMADEKGMIRHAEVRIGDSVVMTFDAKKDWPETPGFLRLYADDCEKVYKQAQKAGAVSVTKPTDMPWGDRVCRIRDPFGNLWWIMTRMEEVGQKEIEKRFQEKKYIDAMQYVENSLLLKSPS